MAMRTRPVTGKALTNLDNAFFEKLEKNEDWELTGRMDGRVMKKVPARELWNQIAYAAWRCADPGTQYNTTINEWHTCPEGGRINASNPCSEYMFLDDTACNLASMNLLTFFADGTLDASFSPAPNGAVTGIVVQPDGRIVVEPLHDKTVGLSQLPETIAQLADDPSSAIKVLVDPSL